jgi:protein ImuA
MAPASQPAAIAELRRRLERMTGHGGSKAVVLPFGIEAVDTRLPGGGLCLGHLHEIVEAGSASEHAAIASIFAAGILARLPGPVLWCLRVRDLFAPALARVGLHSDRIIYCETWKDRDVLPAMEEGLRCKGLAGVVGEATRLSLNTSRRLQLCAGETGVTAVVIRRWRHAGDKEHVTEPNAAAARWRIAPSPSPNGPFDELERQHWRVELLRVRGGEPHSWILEACDAQGHLALPAALAERPVAAGEQRRARAG